MTVRFAVPPGVAPAWDAAVLRDGEVLYAERGGEIAGVPIGGAAGTGAPVLFDVASLTKVVATGTLAALLVKEGKVGLDAPAADWLPDFRGGGRERVTVRQLLAHSSGLPWWRPWFERAAADPVAGQAFLPPDMRPGDLRDAFARGRELVEDALWQEPLEAPPGTRALYGDPAFLALGFLLERAGGAPLDRLFADRVAMPLGLHDTFFVGPGRMAVGLAPCAGQAYAPTERCAHRGEVNRGAVNDDNAWAMGGVAGHAGIFSTARDVARLGQEWLDALDGRGRILDEGVANEFARRDATPGSERALAWDTPSLGGESGGSSAASSGASTIGARLGRGPLGAIGHLGYTGCSLWIDRDRGLSCALLTNHVHPDGRRPAEILATRQAFHDAVAEAVG
jgi:CubicO group peptidase (beta-lactamase class C family)